MFLRFLLKGRCESTMLSPTRVLSVFKDLTEELLPPKDRATVQNRLSNDQWDEDPMVAEGQWSGLC